MFKSLPIFIIFLFLAGGIFAVGNKVTASSGCSHKPGKKTIKAHLPNDPFKAKYWVISSIFRQ